MNLCLWGNGATTCAHICHCTIFPFLEHCVFYAGASTDKWCWCLWFLLKRACWKPGFSKMSYWINHTVSLSNAFRQKLGIWNMIWDSTMFFYNLWKHLFGKEAASFTGYIVQRFSYISYRKLYNRQYYQK